MTPPITHSAEDRSNADREAAARFEPRSLRTYTPTQAVLARSAGIYHWTPEGRRLYDFTSGVLVSNLGHNPVPWMRRFCKYMGWPTDLGQLADDPSAEAGYFSALPMTAYNAVTPSKLDAARAACREAAESPRWQADLEQVMWAASGSEAIQKALWAAMARDRTRPMILATRFGFHGKKGSPGAVTGSETDPSAIRACASFRLPDDDECERRVPAR
jgi:4-aminobutyrate aminotransferase-like enzyme